MSSRLRFASRPRRWGHVLQVTGAVALCVGALAASGLNPSPQAASADRALGPATRAGADDPTAGRVQADASRTGAVADRPGVVAPSTGPSATPVPARSRPAESSRSETRPALTSPAGTSSAGASSAGTSSAGGLPVTSAAGGSTQFGTPFSGDPLSARGGPFGPTSVWRQSIRSAPTAGNSAALVANLARQAASQYGGVAAFNNGAYGETYYTVGATQGRVDVRWDDCQHKGYTPPGLLGPGGQFTSVPIPSDARPSTGTDHALSIYQPATDTLWAFWITVQRSDGWHACWGGRIDRASTSPGWFGKGFGVSATGLAPQGGTVNIKDVQAGSINHALALQVVTAASWTNLSWPAQRSDGSSTAADAIPEGTRFRLDPRVNVDALRLSPVAAMIARAAQTYGFIVTDRAGCVSIVAEDGGPAQAATGVNPWKASLGGVASYAVMAGFPWASLQALPKDYGKP
jgi:hypothetical protein